MASEEHRGVVTAGLGEELCRRFVVLRTAVSLALGSTLLGLWRYELLPFDPRLILFVLLPLALAGNAVWLSAIKRIRPGVVLILQLVIDEVLFAVGLASSVGVQTPFDFLLLLPVYSASLVSTAAVLGVSMLSVFLYGVLAFAQYFTALTVRGSGMALAVLREHAATPLFMVFMILVGFQAYYVVSRIRRKEKELLQMKDEFLFRTVHDLRAPLTTVRMIFSKYSNPRWLREHPDLKEEAILVRNANSRMLNLVKDLFSAAQGESASSAFRQESVDLHKLIQSVAKELGPQLREKDVRVMYVPIPEMPVVRGDGERLKEVFVNLVDNAIKYNRRGGMIHLWHRRAGDRLHTFVQDTGIGIARPHLSQLFTPYFRAASDKKIQGTGLGLYIVRQLLKRMGGYITVRSQLGKGTSFRVTLPVVDAAPHSERRQQWTPLEDDVGTVGASR